MATTRDLNLLPVLDALLQEASVTRAAAHVRLTTPATSRALGRLREALGDPILVRAGRGMVLTPFAESLRERVHVAHLEVGALLGPAASAPVETLTRTLVVRGSDAVAAVLAGPLHERATREAPRLRVRFVPEGDEEAAPLRDGRIDLDIGAIDLVEPELRRQTLLRDRFVGVVRQGHALGRGTVSAKRLVRFAHLGVSRQGRAAGPLDAVLARQGLVRDVASVVPTFFAALFAVASSDLVTFVPELVARHAQGFLPLHVFSLPVAVPPLTVAQAWHPRFDADPAHRWLRQSVPSVVRTLRTRGQANQGARGRGDTA